MIRIIKVTGESLSPSFQDGDYVIIITASRFIDNLRPGDVIVFDHDDYGRVIKMVDRINPLTGEIYVTGTHEYSLNSIQLGTIASDSIIGRVIWHISGPKRSSN